MTKLNEWIKRERELKAPDKAIAVIEELHSCVQKLYAMPSSENYNWVSIEAEKALENIEKIIEG